MATLRDLRVQLGMTQQQLADALGVGLRTVKGYEGADDAPRMAVLACERLLSLHAPVPEQPSNLRASVLDILPANLEARLNALEARLPRGVPSIDELKAKADRTLANDDLVAAAKARKLAELEALEADQATVVPMNPYRPAPLTPAEEAARKARRAAAKAAHISSGEPWDE